MRASNLYAPTLREVPAEAEVPSHQLLLRAGFIRRAAGGVYSYLPLALRVLKKIEQIVREEMDAKGGQEILMPIVQPAELWQNSGRWDVYGDEMFRLKDRHNRDFCLGPTHEEMITTLVNADVRSYRQLPLLVYQIQNKYRDEVRPRFGLMRGREFIMKDLYSFDCDQEGLDISYNKMYDAYSKIFTRCGLEYRAVEADSGAIGGSGSHEFMVLANTGEAEIVYCISCDFAANTEKAELHPIAIANEDLLPLEKVKTPDSNTIEALVKYLQIPIEKTVKAVAYSSEKGLILAFVRGDHEVNEIKVLNACGVINLTMASEQDLQKANITAGYIGVFKKADVTIVVDTSVMNMHNFVCGADEKEHHCINVNPERDFTPDIITDIRMIQITDPCPRCGSKIEKARGIEVGQVFKLQTKYSEKLSATFLDENGREKPMVMGCYGIGVSRTMAASIEQNFDENGIIWPLAIAPYHVVVVPVNVKSQEHVDLAEKLYNDFNAQNIETVLDDRNERAGVKFKDADLIGYPVRITVGNKAIEENLLEVTIRKTKEILFIKVEDIHTKLKEILSNL